MAGILRRISCGCIGKPSAHSAEPRTPVIRKPDNSEPASHDDQPVATFGPRPSVDAVSVMAESVSTAPSPPTANVLLLPACNDGPNKEGKVERRRPYRPPRFFADDFGAEGVMIYEAPRRCTEDGNAHGESAASAAAPAAEGEAAAQEAVTGATQEKCSAHPHQPPTSQESSVSQQLAMSGVDEAAAVDPVNTEEATQAAASSNSVAPSPPHSASAARLGVLPEALHTHSPSMSFDFSRDPPTPQAQSPSHPLSRVDSNSVALTSEGSLPAQEQACQSQHPVNSGHKATPFVLYRPSKLDLTPLGTATRANKSSPRLRSPGQAVQGSRSRRAATTIKDGMPDSSTPSSRPRGLTPRKEFSSPATERYLTPGSSSRIPLPPLQLSMADVISPQRLPEGSKLPTPFSARGTTQKGNGAWACSGAGVAPDAMLQVSVFDEDEDEDAESWLVSLPCKA